ncbi:MULTISPECIES: aminotransferase class III-fold pyridoxal phosphate-dependent enzyme [Actinosynnema]|uniref:aminotransferase class III-fold pyridoxal phosphate-dependent enzyme n=1 Tax=Actinosynnema TaxID=40566 RepID=UPI0020A28609|nr:aminotransferase class III-fold pyridoxal phosphate-dependent enzyme [Actinosynnema pretiosum]MCP2099802.1 ornithine--oxo-acid transaminase [Actinosynnema pretiosum]
MDNVGTQQEKLDWFDRAAHMNQYDGARLPFGCTGASGIVQRFVELGGADAGREFEVFDASGGYASACLGAGSPVVRDALVRAVDHGEYVTDEVASVSRARLLSRLFGREGLWADRFPVSDYHVSGRNSGSEGVELALRLALESRFDRRRLRHAEGKAERDIVLGFEGAWHGWTSGLVPVLNRRHYRVGLPAQDSGDFGVTTRHIPYGELEIAEEFFAEHGHRVLAVVVEPVQGDAGILVPPPGYLRGLTELAASSGALVIADEVLTFAKTGRFFGMTDERGPIPTDVTVIGKSLGMGALSTSMVIARRELTVRATGAIATSDLRPLTCEVIRSGIDHVVSSGLLESSAHLGGHLTGLLDELVRSFPDVFRESRGLGVMHGVELTERAADKLTAFREQVIRSGVYVEFMSGAGRRSHGLRYVFPTMRVAPPLTTTPEQAGELVARLHEGARAFAEAHL